MEQQYKINKYIHKFKKSGDIKHLYKMVHHKNMIGGALNQTDIDNIKRIHHTIKEKCKKQTRLAYMDIDATNISHVIVNKLILSELIDTILLKPQIRFHNIMKEKIKNALSQILEREYNYVEPVNENVSGEFSIKMLLIRHLKFIGFNVEYFDLYPTFSYFCNKHIDNMSDSFLLLRLKNIIDRMIKEFISKYTANELKNHIKDHLKKISTNMCATVENYSLPHEIYSENQRIAEDQRMRIVKINKLKYVYTIIDDEMIKINMILKNNIDVILNSIIDAFNDVFRDFNKEQAEYIKEYIIKNDDIVSLFIDGFVEVDVGIETEREIFNQILNIDERVNNYISTNVEVKNYANNKKNEFDIVIGKFDRINKTYDIATIIDIKHSAKLIIDDAEKFDSAINSMNTDKDVLLHPRGSDIIYRRDEYAPKTNKGYIYKVPFNHSTSVYILLNMMTEFVKSVSDNNIIIDIFKIYTKGQTTDEGNYMINILDYKKIDHKLLERYNAFIVEANAKLNKLASNFIIFHCDIKTPGEKFQPFAHYKNDYINILYRQPSTEEYKSKRLERLERLMEEQQNEYIEGIKKQRIPTLEPEFSIDPDFFS